MNILSTERLSIGYRYARRPDYVIAADLNLTLEPGEFVCLLGPNGAGKSTLLRTLAGMQPPLGGKIWLQNTDLSLLSASERARRLSVVLTERIEIGIFSAYDLVALGRYPYTDWTGRLTPQDDTIIDWAIRAVEAEALAHRNFHELSDGERQKILIARALAQQPVMMILDEPTAFLDLPRRVEIMHMLRKLAHETGCAILLSTHDLDLALRCADRFWLLAAEGAIQTGSPEDLVLSGAFESAFRSAGMVFDRLTGAFQITNGQKETVMIKGEGAAAVWTQRALERAGFKLANDENGSRLHVEIFEQGTAHRWLLREDQQAPRELASLQELVDTLKACLSGK